jgi:hypothetical protein
MQDLLTEIFCSVDDFCINFEKYCKTILIAQNYTEASNFKVCSSTTLELSEIITIIIYFHLSNYRDFKHYYTFRLCYRSAFQGR